MLRIPNLLTGAKMKKQQVTYKRLALTNHLCKPNAEKKSNQMMMNKSFSQAKMIDIAWARISFLTCVNFR